MFLSDGFPCCDQKLQVYSGSQKKAVLTRFGLIICIHEARAVLKGST